MSYRSFFYSVGVLSALASEVVADACWLQTTVHLCPFGTVINIALFILAAFRLVVLQGGVGCEGRARDIGDRRVSFQMAENLDL